MEDSRIGTSHGGLKKFGSEAAKNTPPTPKMKTYVHGAGVWRLIDVYPTDTI